MAKKCPKNFNKFFHQKTLAETWFSKRSPDTKRNEKGKSDENNFVNDQSMSDDSDFVASSQDTTESKLRKKLNQTLPRRSTRLSNSSPENVHECVSRKPKSNAIPQNTPKLSLRKLKTPNSTPKKNNPSISPSISDKKLSIISDVCEVNSTVIKEEIDEMLQNVSDFDSVEMMHDLSGLIAGEEILPNGLEYSTLINTCEANALSTDEGEGQEEQDPLYIDEKEKNSVLLKKVNKKSNKNIKIKKERKKQRRTIDNEQEELSDEMLRILKEMHVKLQHKVPPQHKIENCAGSRPLNEKQILLFETYGPLKRGPFTKIEDEIIKTNWTNFCELHNWNEKWVEPFLNMRHEGKYYIPNLEERKNFVRFLSNGLPWRSLYSVYFRFKNLYNTVSNGPYTAKEDEKIIEHISKATPSRINKTCAELARSLNRKRHSIWQRYQKLKVMYNIKSTKLDDSHESDLESEEEKNNKNKRKSSSLRMKKSHEDEPFKKVYKEVKWSYPLVSRFIEKLLEIMSCEHLEELKNQTIDEEIWKKMERKISIDYTVLQNFWNLHLHMQLFCPKPLYLNDLKMDLIKYLHKNKINADSIQWDEMKPDFNGVTPAFLSKLFDYLVKYVKTKLNTTDIKMCEIIEYLYNIHIPELEEKTDDIVLPKLYYKNDRIIGVYKASEKRPSKGTTANPLSDEEYKNQQNE